MASRGQRREGRSDRRDRGLVAGQQVPVGVRVGSVGAAGSPDRQGVSRTGLRGPRPGDTLVAVDDEVDRQGAGGGVGLEGGVGAHHLTVAGREGQLHVAVGEDAVGEGAEVVGAEADPDEVRAATFGGGDDEVGGGTGHDDYSRKNRWRGSGSSLVRQP